LKETSVTSGAQSECRSLVSNSIRCQKSSLSNSFSSHIPISCSVAVYRCSIMWSGGVNVLLRLTDY